MTDIVELSDKCFAARLHSFHDVMTPANAERLRIAHEQIDRVKKKRTEIAIEVDEMIYTAGLCWHQKGE